MLPGLEVACSRCERRGRLSTARLLAEHDPDMWMPELLRVLAADCPKMREGLVYDVCGAYYPERGRLKL